MWAPLRGGMIETVGWVPGKHENESMNLSSVDGVEHEIWVAKYRRMPSNEN
jgi:hypothetical protein